MVQRFHLDVVRNEKETIWFTLVMEDPIGYYVEQYNESVESFVPCRTRIIERPDFTRHHVNDVPLIKLVENKFREIAESSQVRQLVGS